MSMNMNVLGLIFASINDRDLDNLSKKRTTGSVPFAGRYRLIDFPLSSMVNSGIQEVGVITKSKYGSLMDHLGSGREWDLARKKGGLHLLPPFSQTGFTTDAYVGRLALLNNVWDFVDYSRSEYTVLSNCDVVTNIDYGKVIEQHRETGADVTIVCAKGQYNFEKNKSTAIVSIDEEKNVKDVLINPPMTGECLISLDMFVMRTDFLKKIVQEAASSGEHSLMHSIFQRRKDEFKLMAYVHDEVFLRVDSPAAYLKNSLMLQQADVRKSLFNSEFPIYTKTGDNPPVKYGLAAKVTNSTIADGCVVEGTVENCVLFRGVKIAKGAVVKNSVIMQGSVIGEGAVLDHVIVDKDAVISENSALNGSDESPTYVEKKSKI